jgi:hypothetical protein
MPSQKDFKSLLVTAADVVLQKLLIGQPRTISQEE